MLLSGGIVAYLGPFTVEFRQVTLCSNHIKNIQWVCLGDALENVLLQINVSRYLHCVHRVCSKPVYYYSAERKIYIEICFTFSRFIKLHSQVVPTNLYFLGWIDQMEQFFNINHCDLRLLRST